MATSRNCFVPKCTNASGNAPQKKTCGSLFKAPKDPRLLKKWQRAIPRADRTLMSTNVVCELHFLDDDIIRHYQTKLPDGKIEKISRGRPMLRPGAVPCIFPSFPSYLTKNYKQRQPHILRSSVTATVKDPSQSTSPHEAENEGTHNEKEEVVDAEEEGTHAEQGEVVETKNEGTREGQGEVVEAEKETTHAEQKVVEVENEDIHEEQREVVEVEVHTCNTLFTAIKMNLSSIVLPSPNWTGAYIPGLDEVVWCEWTKDHRCEKKLLLKTDMTFKVLLGSSEVKMDTGKINEVGEIEHFLKRVHAFRLCEEVHCRSASESCSGFLPERKLGQRGVTSLKCLPCRLSRKRRNRRNNNVPIIRRHEKIKGSLKCVKRKNGRLKQKVNRLRNEIETCKTKCANLGKEMLEEAISTLPMAQQQAIRTCFAAAKLKGPRGQRYSHAWIYECLLLRIKGKAAYEHIRTKHLLPLPSINTLNKYQKRITGTYGFSKSLFEVLKRKAQYMSEEERRGTLLIDEMKLSELVHFNRKSMKFDGFTNLGKHTPLHQATKRGDHALVMMFHPLRGSWMQAIACFLSKGCASSTILHHLIMECIILLEKCNFFVDVVTTDGASWNRTMWKKFGISEESVSCEHICSSSRRLWFCSDFPHLIKNVRNFIVSKTETWTPEGVVKLAHWDAVVEMEDPKSFKLKISPKLTHDDVHPKPYQKMNVGRAYRFFGDKTAAAMEIYKEHHMTLSDCDPSIKLMRRFGKLIGIMSSRTPIDNPLRKGSADAQFIKEFLVYLEQWAACAKASNYYFLSDSTYIGLRVTLKATLEILDFLSDTCGYQYLMTSRLNQDSLERFFGMIRGACGSNDHPDSFLFLQIFRLMSTYSLVKPPKGSNVEGSELLSTLVNVREIADEEEKLTDLQLKLDLVLDEGTLDSPLHSNNGHDHDYNIQRTSEVVQAYVSGYIARKAKRFSRCEQCLKTLKSSQPDNTRDKLITLLSKGYLIYLSLSLFALIGTLEEKVLNVLSSSPINHNTFFDIAAEIEQTKLPSIGCEADGHKESFTEAVVKFFLTTRMFFICKRANSMEKAAKEKSKQLRKQAKL